MKEELFYDKDVQLDILRDRRIAIIGYGSQGQAHAQNLNDQGLDVRVGLRSLKSPSYQKASDDGLKVDIIEKVSEWADLIMLLIPDEDMASCYAELVEPHLKEGKALAFAHGFNIHFSYIHPPKNIDVFLVAPKGPGRLVRQEFSRGRGVPCLLAVHQDATGQCQELGLAYAKGIGGTRAGVLKTNFREETETDLFGEQTVLCGGLSSLIAAGFETLVEAGYSPTMAYFECVHEVKLITDLIYEKGLGGMRDNISNTAEYGDYTRGPRIIDDQVKVRMKKVLSEIQEGVFANEWMSSHKQGDRDMKAFREKAKQHPIEKIGHEIRSHLSFFTDNGPEAKASTDDSKIKGQQDGKAYHI